jgi:hypothetical protein
MECLKVKKTKLLHFMKLREKQASKEGRMVKKGRGFVRRRRRRIRRRR